MHLHAEQGLQLDKALWTARQTNGGFSVTFFWPALEPKSAQDLKTVAKKRRKRRRHKKKAQPKHEVVETQHSRDSKENEKDSTPIVAHQCSQESSTSNEEVNEPVDLTACETVTYEKRNEVPGVKYTLDGNETWTPVIRRKRRPRHSSSGSSSSEFDVSCSRMVQYQECNGLSIHRRNVKWTSIEPSPVAFRTRSRTKDT